MPKKGRGGGWKVGKLLMASKLDMAAIGFRVSPKAEADSYIVLW